MPEVSLDNVSRIGPGGVLMGKVAGPHAVFDAPPIEVILSYRIFEESIVNAVLYKGDVNLPPKILAGLHSNGKRFDFICPPVVIVPLLQHERNPANLILHDDDFQSRIALQNSVKD
jgi:hypothetical protein